MDRLQPCLRPQPAVIGRCLQSLLPRMLLHARSGFWQCHGMQEKDRETCMGAVRARFLEHDIEEFEEQGHCSFTIIIASLSASAVCSNEEGSTKAPASNLREHSSCIVQIRPVRYALDLDITQIAKKTYSALAPHIQDLGLALPKQLCAYEMERLHGTPFSRLQPHRSALNLISRRKQEILVACFAEFIVQGWRAGSETLSLNRKTRADSPMDDKSPMLAKCTGKVGISIISRLEKVASKLPDQRLRNRARHRLNQIRKVTCWPVTLNHGDLIPSNILIDEETWKITGIVDWAEAEYLPFGTCLYGLEHLLGYLSPASRSPAPVFQNTCPLSNPPGFVYFENAPELRAVFWARLFESVPELVRMREEVEMFRDMGVLLWYGIAWDDGAINRVVNEVDDAEAVACLRAFLFASN